MEMAFSHIIIPIKFHDIYGPVYSRSASSVNYKSVGVK